MHYPYRDSSSACKNKTTGKSFNLSHPPTWNQNKEIKFRMMDVSVAILGLTGIASEIKAWKHVQKKLKEKRKGTDKITTSASSTSSTHSVDVDDGIPVKAVISFSKHVHNSQTTIASHLPSLNLQHTEIPTDGLCQLRAIWPNDFDPLGNELSTFKFTRTMQIETEGHRTNRYRSTDMPMLIPERVQLRISLTRGSEMITVGYATLVISGDEAQDVQVNLPISLERIEENDISTKWKNKRSIKPASFSNDPLKRHYFLNSQSRLKVLLRVTPTDRNDGPRVLTPSQDVPEIVSLSSASGSQCNESRDVPVSQQYSENYVLNPSHYSTTLLHDQASYYFETPHVTDTILTHAENIDRDDSTFGEYSIEDTAVDTVGTDVSKASVFTRIVNLFSCDGHMCVSTTPGLPLVKPNSKYRHYDKKQRQRGSIKNSLETSRYRGKIRHASASLKSPYKDRHDEFSVATEKVQNLGNSRSTDSQSLEFLEAKHTVDKYASRMGIDPSKII
jgi:hypothetical protein